ncbi:DUF3885 domain-containing protein [Microbispora bryophytorum]|uniref:DUF3885 domain-containing protein n=1 Tax=Microbispora bryophytorum TaxID=1460882 RepID=UPI003F4CFD87
MVLRCQFLEPGDAPGHRTKSLRQLVQDGCVLPHISSVPTTSHYPDRWTGFHSLPESKRNTDSEAEYAIVLDRHCTVPAELDPSPDLLVITADWTNALRDARQGVMAWSAE